MKKSDVLHLLQAMPDHFDADELMDRLYVIRQIEASEVDIAAGDVIPHEEVVRITDEWIGTGPVEDDTLEDLDGKTPKDDVRRMLDGIPDDVTFEDIHYHIYVVEKIRRGLQDIEGGRLLSQEEVEQEMSRWFKEWRGEQRPRPNGDAE